MRRIASLGLLALALNSAACDRTGDEARKRIVPEYDKATGRLQLLKYDSNGDGKVDTWSYMDGPRVVRIEIDKNGDGTVDRWEYYTPDQKIEKIGFSRANDGKEDAWSYSGADGSIERTRPLCVYPQVARWTGRGSTDDAANFSCVTAR